MTTIPPRPHRPFAVTLYAAGVCAVSAFYLIRFYNTLVQWEYLSGLLPFSPAYLLVTGIAWGLVGLMLAWSLWRGWYRVRRMFWVLFLAHGIYFWSERILITVNPDSRANDIFWAVSFCCLIVISVWVMHHHSSNAFFVRNSMVNPISGAKHE